MKSNAYNSHIPVPSYYKIDRFYYYNPLFRWRDLEGEDLERKGYPFKSLYQTGNFVLNVEKLPLSIVLSTLIFESSPSKPSIHTRVGNS